MRFCSACGRELSYEGKFCIYCGIPVPEQGQDEKVNAVETSVGHSAEANVGHSAEANVGHSAEANVGHSAEANVGHSHNLGQGQFPEFIQPVETQQTDYQMAPPQEAQQNAYQMPQQTDYQMAPPQKAQQNAYQPQQQTVYQMAPPQQEAFDFVASPKKKKRFAPALIGLAALVIVCICVGWLTLRSDDSFYTALQEGLGKTVDSGAFDVKFSMTESNGTQEAFDASVAFDFDKKMLNFRATEDMYEYVLYDGYALTIDEDGKLLECKNVKDDMEAFWNQYGEILDEVAKAEDLDFEEVINEAWKEITKKLYPSDMEMDPSYSSNMELDPSLYIDMSSLNDCFDDFAKKLNDEEYLKEKFGYEVEQDDGETTYSMKIQSEILAEEVIDIFSPAFDMLALLNPDEMAGVTVRYAMTEQDGYLKGMDLKVMYDDETVAVKFECSNFGEPSFDEDGYKDLLEEAKDSGYIE